MRYLRLLLIAAIVIGSSVGIFSMTSAQDSSDGTGATYILLAGTTGSANMDILAFAPQSLQVHRGDTVVWQFFGFHNVRFAEQPVDLIVAPVVDGNPLPQINPIIAFPSIESGASYTGGTVGSGLPSGSAFSLVMDVEPGTYAYLCDVHPGMVGTITVVEDNVEIPSPTETFEIGAREISAQIGAGLGAYAARMQSHSGMEMPAEGEAAEVMSGARGGASTVEMFFPAVVTVRVGESVTWVMAEGTPAEPHTVTSYPLPSEEEQLIVMPPAGEGQPPMIALGEPWFPNVEDGQEINADDAFNSGLVLPGQTITLTFNDPGVYMYGCYIHPGMIGAVVVVPAE
jgi:plastocyanin